MPGGKAAAERLARASFLADILISGENQYEQDSAYPTTQRVERALVAGGVDAVAALVAAAVTESVLTGALVGGEAGSGVEPGGGTALGIFGGALAAAIIASAVADAQVKPWCLI
jgi:hypothetical protein